MSFVLRQATALAGFGNEVTLAGYHTLPRTELEKIHQVAVPPSVTVAAENVSKWYSLNSTMPWKLSAYMVLALPGYRRWLRRLLSSAEYDLIWFHDDIPSAASDLIQNKRIALYVHFPLAARKSEVVPPLAKSRTFSEAVSETFLQKSDIVHDFPFQVTPSVWVNSTVTSRVVHGLWGHLPMGIGPTYPTSRSLALRKQNILLSIGAISKGKNYGTLIEDFAESRESSWKLRIIGHSRDPAELLRLRRAIRRHNLQDLVTIVTNAPRDEVENSLLLSKAYIQAAEFEPLGLSLLEAMAHACFPIVRKSDWSGGWTDLLASGRYGWSYSNGQDLSEAMRVADSSDRGGLDAYERAQSYSKAAFEEWTVSTLKDAGP